MPTVYRDKNLRRVTIDIEVMGSIVNDNGQIYVVRLFESRTQFSFRLALRYHSENPPENRDSIVLDFAKCIILDGSYRFHEYNSVSDNSSRKPIIVSNETEDNTKFHSQYAWGINDFGQVYIDHPLATGLNTEEKYLGRQIVIDLLTNSAKNNRAKKKDIVSNAHFPEIPILDALDELVREGHIEDDNQDLVLVGNPLREQIGFR